MDAQRVSLPASSALMLDAFSDAAAVIIASCASSGSVVHRHHEQEHLRSPEALHPQRVGRMPVVPVETDQLVIEADFAGGRRPLAAVVAHARDVTDPY